MASDGQDEFQAQLKLFKGTDIKEAFCSSDILKSKLSPMTVKAFMLLRNDELHKLLVDVTTYDEFHPLLKDYPPKYANRTPGVKRSSEKVLSSAKQSVKTPTSLPKPFKIAPCRNLPNCKYGDACHFIHPSTEPLGTCRTNKTSVW
jgi:hypothetical protein